MALGDDTPLGPGFQILGEQRLGRPRHPGRSSRPATSLPRPAGRSWEECAAYPLATLTAWRMLRRARLAAGERCLIVGIGGGCQHRRPRTWPCAWAPRSHVTVPRPGQGRGRARPRRRRRPTTRGAEFPVQAHVVVESVGPATWDRSVRALLPGGRLVVCGGTSGQTVEIDLPRLFFKQHEIIGSTMGSYGEFAAVTELRRPGPAGDRRRGLRPRRLPAALARLEAGAQLGKLVLRHE